MRTRKSKLGKIVTTIAIEASQDNWLREHNEINFSQFVREKLEELIKKGENKKNE